MFDPDERSELLEAVLDRARAAHGVTAAALLGSYARGEQDRWSDLDLAFRLAAGQDPRRVADDWSAWFGTVGTVGEVVDQLDIWASGALYRVFLLDSSLQVDLSFWPEQTFRALGADFRLVFGEAGTPVLEPPGEPRQAVRWGWLYALHARSAIARGRRWQAVQMLEALRGALISSACRRHGLPDHDGRGVDRLPPQLTGRLESTLITSTAPDDLRLVLSTLIDELIMELGATGGDSEEKLITTLRGLVLDPDG